MFNESEDVPMQFILQLISGLLGWRNADISRLQFARRTCFALMAGITACSGLVLSEPGQAGTTADTVTNCANAGAGSLRSVIEAARSRSI
jgi:hypothetical protein